MSKNERPEADAPSQVFVQEDILDFAAIIEKLKDGSEISKRLVTLLSAQGKRLLEKGWNSNADDQRWRLALLNELNSLATRLRISDSPIPAGFAPRKYTLKVLNSTRPKDNPTRANKLILQDVFGSAISRRPGRGKIGEQKHATVSKRKLKSGNYAVFLNLVTSRNLLGRFEKAGRKKWERRTPDLARSLCLTINAELENRKLERELTAHEVELATQLIFSLQKHHPDWLEHLPEAIDALDAADWKPGGNSIPSVSEAAEIYLKEVVAHSQPDTQFNYRVTFSYMMPRFGAGPPNNMTDVALRRFANGPEPIMRMTSESRIDRLDAEGIEKHLWIKEVPFKGARPWKKGTKRRFLACVRAFKNWMHSSEDPVTGEQRNWCPKSQLKLPPLKDESFHPAPRLTVQMSQTLLDVAFVCFDGRVAAFIVKGLFSGGRVKEIRRNRPESTNVPEASVRVPVEASKNKVARTSYLTENAVVMAAALRAVGLYEQQNLRPTRSELMVVKVLAGFKCNEKKILIRAERERARLKACGIELPEYNWGMYFPRNGLRRTAINMHNILFGDLPRTVFWAGTSTKAFTDWYERLTTKEEARPWVLMLPSWWKGKHRPRVRLPEDHKLDIPNAEGLQASVKTGTQAMRYLTSQLANAEEAIAIQKLTETKAKRRDYQRRWTKEHRRKLRSKR